MECPKCDGTLVPLESAGGDANRCNACGGFWIRRSLIDDLIRDATSVAGVPKKAIGLLETAPQPTDRMCPECPKSRLEALQFRAVPVERCTGCTGVFLDEDELELITARVIEAQREWNVEAASWAELVEKLRLEEARQREEAAKRLR